MDVLLAVILQKSLGVSCDHDVKLRIRPQTIIAAKYSTYVILLSLPKIFSSITLQMVIFNYRSNVKNDPNSLLKLIESTDSAKIWLGKSMNHPMMLFRKNYSHLITVGAMSLISLNSTVTRVTHSRGTSAASCES